MANDMILSREACQALADRVRRMARGPGTTRVAISSVWLGDVRWGRNRTMMAGDARDVIVRIMRRHRAAAGRAETSRLDDAGLEAAVRWAEEAMRAKSTVHLWDLPPGTRTFAKPTIWSGATIGLTSAARGDLVRSLIQPAEAAGLFSAGYLAVGAFTEAFFDPDGQQGYCARTTAQCSISVRDPSGRGSGWAGGSAHDWAALDPVALARRAQEKCRASREPVAVEPGRYTVVLEPQAVGDLMDLVTNYLGRPPAERGDGPFADRQRPGFSKLGLKVADERVSFGHDPEDPELGVCPFNAAGEPYRAVRWVERGVLTALTYDRAYAVEEFNENIPLPNSRALRMQGGETTIEEMIRTTRRGLLVTRFSGLRVTDHNALLASGVTRDGLWLIENGKISKAVKNFGFSESPLFVLNSLEQLGPPVPVFRLDQAEEQFGQHDRPAFRAHVPMIVPPLKARDFNFNRLVDAV
ncbi:MAG: metallopeptidase TldD-related protein [Gemmatimonadaceae bacterium]|nr:metallopeptidase TldD-related protein [Gemmatimonadaceae bacterium]